MKLASFSTQIFGKERAALIEAEVENLCESNYSQRDLTEFLETYAFSLGVFYLLSMLKRSTFNIIDMREALSFLFNPTPRIAEMLQTNLQANSKVLDFGCGRGQLTCALTLRGFRAYGVDTSKDVLKIARKLASKLGCDATFDLALKGKFPFPDEFFDASLSFWAFHEVRRNRLRQVAKELSRTVRRGGHLFIIDQDGVAKFDEIKDLVKQQGFRFQSKEALSPVYDHGRASRAIVLTFTKEPC